MEAPPESRLTSELEPGERLLWSGRPKQGLVLRAMDALLIPFSLLWGGFAIFWKAMVVRESWRPQAAHHSAPIFFVPWGVPFVLMGLYLMFGRFITDARMRARTIYGITDRRVLILSGLFSTTVRGFDLRSLSDVSLSEHRGGTGTITFSSAASWTPWAKFATPNWPGMGGYGRPCFDPIHQPRRVYETIREAQRKLG
jgi:hypothetical protein